LQISQDAFEKGGASFGGGKKRWVLKGARNWIFKRKHRVRERGEERKIGLRKGFSADREKNVRDQSIRGSEKIAPSRRGLD